MRRIEAVIVLMALCLTPLNAVAAASYNTVVVSENTFGDDLYPAVNNNGDIVYYHHAISFSTGDPPETYTETGKYLFRQGGVRTTVNVPSNTQYPYYYYHAPMLLLNDLKQMAFQIQDYDDDGKYKVYFINGPGDSPQLLNSSGHSKYYLQLNRNGQVAFLDANSNAQVCFFDGVQVKQITDYDYEAGLGLAVWGLSLNDSGQLVWVDSSYGEGNVRLYHIKLYQDGTTRTVYSSVNPKYRLKINNSGQIAWLEVKSSTYTFDVMLYDGIDARPVSGGTGFSAQYYPFMQLNDKDSIGWIGKTNLDDEYNFFLYRNGATSQITNYTPSAEGGITVDVWANDPDEAKTRNAPYLNNKDELIWVTWVPNASDSKFLDLALNIYSQGSVMQIDKWTVDPSMTANSNVVAEHASYATMNDKGQVVWSRYKGKLVPDLSSRFTIYSATPNEGDVNADNKVDMTDAILCLQILSGIATDEISSNADVDANGKIGIAEAIYIMKNIAEL
jgi:hypothetical protein